MRPTISCWFVSYRSFSATGNCNMPRRYVSELGHQEAIDEVFVATDKQLRPNRNGNLYLQLDLSDRTGSIAARMWNANETLYKSFDNGDYVHVEGTTQLYQGHADDRHAASQGRSGRSQRGRLPAAAGRRGRPARAAARRDASRHGRSVAASLAECFLLDEAFMAKFTRAPAGMKNHHAYLGGLLEHMVNLMEVVVRVGPCYPQINRDLLLMGAFLHDMGKVDELAYRARLRLQRRRATGRPPGHGRGLLDRKVAEAERALGRADPAGNRLAAEAHDRQPPRRVRVRQPQAAHDARSRRPVLPRQPRREAQLVRPAIADDPNVDSPWTTYNANLERKLFKGRKRKAESGLAQEGSD